MFFSIILFGNELWEWRERGSGWCQYLRGGKLLIVCIFVLLKPWGWKTPVPIFLYPALPPPLPPFVNFVFQIAGFPSGWLVNCGGGVACVLHRLLRSPAAGSIGWLDPSPTKHSSADFSSSLRSLSSDWFRTIGESRLELFIVCIGSLVTRQRKQLSNFQ